MVLQCKIANFNHQNKVFKFFILTRRSYLANGTKTVKKQKIRNVAIFFVVHANFACLLNHAKNRI